jgi:N-methylhydantoinase A
MRFVGQGHEISVALPAGPYEEGHREVFRQRFETAYRQLYGRTIEGVEVEALSWTLTLTAPRRQSPKPTAAGRDARTGALAPVGQQELFDPASARPVQAAVYLRDALCSGAAIDGPALITEPQTTTVVPPGWQAGIDEQGGIVLTRREAADE